MRLNNIQKSIAVKIKFKYHMNTHIQQRKIQTRNYTRSFGDNLTNMELSHHSALIKRKSKSKRLSLTPALSCSSMELSPYLLQISSHVHHQEHENYIRENYMPWHTDINYSMRQTLIGWLFSLQHKLGLKSNTIYLAVALLDKYCYSKNISRNKYQLLGITSLFVAAKYEEVKTPKIRNYIENSRFDQDQILGMQSDILLTLNFKIKLTTSHWHIQQQIDHMKFSERHQKFCAYILDLTLIEFSFCLQRPSVLSCSIIFFVSKMTNDSISESFLLKHYNLTKMELVSTINSLNQLFKVKHELKFKSINQKHIHLLQNF